MALKAKLTADEFSGLAGPLQEFYKQAGDSYVLDAEGVEDVSGLKSALEKEREGRKALDKQIKDLTKQFNGVDPEKARAAQAQLEKLEEQGLLDAGKLDAVIEKRTERMRADHDAQIKGWEKKHGEADAQTATLRKKLEEVTIQSGLSQHALKAGAKGQAIDDILLRGSRVWTLDPDGNPVPKKGDAVIYGKNPSQPMTMEEWVTSLRNDAPHLFESNTGGGSEPGRARGGSGNRVVLTREQARDVRTYRQAQEQAQKAGVELVITE